MIINKGKMCKEKLQEEGITLLALVVTIIVLLILAGVTISLALGNNGIMDRAKHASNTWANATKDETTMMGQIESDVDILTEGFLDKSFANVTDLAKLKQYFLRKKCI